MTTGGWEGHYVDLSGTTAGPVVGHKLQFPIREKGPGQRIRKLHPGGGLGGGV